MYNYQTERVKLFTDDGQRIFLRIRDHARKLIATAGAARLGKIIEGAECGDSFVLLACVDRLVELGELREVAGAGVPTQQRVYVMAGGQ